jgi:hypothetical protein
MAGASISHVLIVAGPSGAGKSAFLSELAAGRLPPEIAHHLPEGAHTWREVWCNRPHEWQPFIGGAKAPGIAVHYDITLKWLSLEQSLEQDPFWDLLQHCEAATVVNIRPTRRRLLRQWVRAHLGLDSVWAVHRKRLLSALSHRALPALRRLRTARPNRRKPHFNRYPRRIRFLKHWDRMLERVQFSLSPSFDFYRRPGGIEQMLRSWDAIAAHKLDGVPARQIELAPSSDGAIAKTFRWRVVEVSEAPKRPAKYGGMHVTPAMSTLVGTIATLC